MFLKAINKPLVYVHKVWYSKPMMGPLSLMDYTFNEEDASMSMFGTYIWYHTVHILGDHVISCLTKLKRIQFSQNEY